MTVSAKQLDRLYARYNRKEFIHPDPLEFVYRYADIRDREIVGLIASSLAYGRVFQILRSVETVLRQMIRPAEFIRQARLSDLEKLFRNFKHRFTTGQELAILLFGIKRAIERYGSLEQCFLTGYQPSHETIHSAAMMFIRNVSAPFQCRRNSLLPMPDGKCAYKRLNLYLRWMVRHDEVDPGGWTGVSKSKLIVPLDTHMHRIGLAMGWTHRKQADIRAAEEITAWLRKYSPHDAVKYDFALTRLGILPDGNLKDFLTLCGKA